MAKSKGDAAEVNTTKMQMVEEALDAVGDEASPTQLQPWIKDNYGTEIDRQMISSYASQIRKRRRGGAAASGAVRVGGGADAISMRDIGLIKGLVDQYGAANLTNIIKVLSR